MFMNRQRKQTFTQRLNNTQILQTSISDSLADSNLNKRFNRTRNSIEENNKKSKLSKGSEYSALGDKKLSLSIENYTKQSKYIYKPEELFLKISDTPFKDRTHLQATSDRTTESTYFAETNQPDDIYICTQFEVQQEDYTSLKQQLNIKNTEIKSLQSTLHQINNQQQKYITTAKQREEQYKTQISMLRDQINNLKADLQEKNTTIKQMKKNQTNFAREIKSVKYHKNLLQKQYQQLFKKKIPKEIKELISYREQSLQLHIQQLNHIIQTSKTQVQSNLQQQIICLNEENSKYTSKIKELSIQISILNKKWFDCQSTLKQNTQSFNRWYYQMKENQTELLCQLKQIRKQNIKLLRMRGHKPKCDQLSSQQSLTLSLQDNV